MVTSPLRRCRQTAQVLVSAHNRPVEIHTERALTECGYGEWTGRKLSDLGKEKLWSAVQTQPSAVRFPGGEAMSEMASRAVTAIRGWDARLGAEHGRHTVWAAVSHGDVIKAILADALGMHLDSFQRILVDPASVSIVSYTASRPYVITTNSTNADLGKLLAPPPKKRTRPRSTPPDSDASVGGGLGAADQLG
jgi:2,3-bisphosphoglycerate-dependent phosphoglycerate mutase